MRPIADGLTALEGNICFGTYLPYLFGIRSQLDRLKKNTLRFCTPLLTALEDGFRERFNDLMDPYHISSVPLFLAMLCNPKYKMSFMGPLRPTILQKLKNMLLSAAEEIAKEDVCTNECDNGIVTSTLNDDDQKDEEGVYISKQKLILF